MGIHATTTRPCQAVDLAPNNFIDRQRQLLPLCPAQLPLTPALPQFAASVGRRPDGPRVSGTWRNNGPIRKVFPSRDRGSSASTPLVCLASCRRFCLKGRPRSRPLNTRWRVATQGVFSWLNRPKVLRRSYPLVPPCIELWPYKLRAPHSMAQVARGQDRPQRVAVALGYSGSQAPGNLSAFLGESHHRLIPPA